MFPFKIFFAIHSRSIQKSLKFLCQVAEKGAGKRCENDTGIGRWRTDPHLSVPPSALWLLRGSFALGLFSVRNIDEVKQLKKNRKIMACCGTFFSIILRL